MIKLPVELIKDFISKMKDKLFLGFRIERTFGGVLFVSNGLLSIVLTYSSDELKEKNPTLNLYLLDMMHLKTLLLTTIKYKEVIGTMPGNRQILRAGNIIKYLSYNLKNEVSTTSNSKELHEILIGIFDNYTESESLWNSNSGAQFDNEIWQYQEQLHKLRKELYTKLLPMLLISN